RDVLGDPVRIDRRGRLSGPPGSVIALAPPPASVPSRTGTRSGPRSGWGAGAAGAVRAATDSGGRRVRVVSGWAGPWLRGDRWWTHRGAPRQVRAHLQVAFDDGGAVLLTHTDGAWTYEADYD